MQFLIGPRTKFSQLMQLKNNLRACGQLRLQTTVEKASTVGSSSTKMNDMPQTAQNEISIPISLSTANQREMTKFKVNQAVNKFQKHAGDTGSAAVQSTCRSNSLQYFHNLTNFLVSPYS
jgi:hypothetical protein